MILIGNLLQGGYIVSNFLNDSKKLTYTAEVDGEIVDMPYILHVPEAYKDMDSLPILLFLHGEGETWSDETSDTAILQKLIDSGKHPCVFLAPKCVPGRNWCDWQMAKLALGLSNEIRNTFNCDSSRFYIMGFGMGAFAIYDFIGHESDNNGIAAAVTIGGAYMFELLENIKKVPLWIFYGDSDYSVEEYSKKMLAELEKAGANNHKSSDYSKADNKINFICDETDLFAWLFGHKRGGYKGK